MYTLMLWQITVVSKVILLCPMLENKQKTKYLNILCILNSVTCKCELLPFRIVVMYSLEPLQTLSYSLLLLSHSRIMFSFLSLSLSLCLSLPLSLFHSLSLSPISLFPSLPFTPPPSPSPSQSPCEIEFVCVCFHISFSSLRVMFSNLLYPGCDYLFT
jgi:hypothetical protein